MFGMRKRVLLVEKFVHVLIVLRAFSSHLIPLEVYIGVLLFFLAVQYVKEGFMPTIILMVPIVGLQIYSQINGNTFLQYLAALLAGLADFFNPKIYWLPQAKRLVGFREDSLENNLHYYEFYPLDISKPIVEKEIKWHHGKEIDKVLGYLKIKNSFIRKIGHIIMSILDKIKLKIGEGEELKTNSSLIFSHGRGGTPFMSSNFLQYFAAERFKVASVQHSEILETDLKDKAQIKKFREKEVQVRALQIYQAILKADNDKIVLMGHSYGAATVIQAYHTLQPELKRKVTHIILQDPWLFPLSDKKFNEPFDCPVLFLANQDFITHEDMYNRNKEYIGLHKLEYVAWKNAHHLHMCDMCFIGGNMFGSTKNSHLSQIMLDFNIDAIDKFLRGEQVEGTLGERDLGRNFKPQKFHAPDKFKF